MTYGVTKAAVLYGINRQYIYKKYASKLYGQLQYPEQRVQTDVNCA